MSDAWCVSLSKSVWTIGIGLRPLWSWWNNMVRWCQTLDSYSPVRVPQLYTWRAFTWHVLPNIRIDAAYTDPRAIGISEACGINPANLAGGSHGSWMEKTDTVHKLSLVWLILQECPTKSVRKCQGLCVIFKKCPGTVSKNEIAWIRADWTSCSCQHGPAKIIHDSMILSFFCARVFRREKFVSQSYGGRLNLLTSSKSLAPPLRL